MAAGRGSFGTPSRGWDGDPSPDPPRQPLSVRRTGPRVAGPDGYVWIGHEDPDLLAGLPEREQALVARFLRAPVLVAGSRRWTPPACDPARAFGLLVLDGLVARRVRVGTRVSTELFTCGDILRPWDTGGEGDLVPVDVEWRVLACARLAVLDGHLTEIIGRRSELLIAFTGRLMRRVHSASFLAAITHLYRVEDRLVAYLWHLASRCGRVTPHGVKIPFRISHETLGEVVGAQRPSVTVSLRRLQERGELARSADGGYLLTGPDDRVPRSAGLTGPP